MKGIIVTLLAVITLLPVAGDIALHTQINDVAMHIECTSFESEDPRGRFHLPPVNQPDPGVDPEEP